MSSGPPSLGSSSSDSSGRYDEADKTRRLVIKLMGAIDKAAYNQKRGHTEKEQFRAQWELDNTHILTAALSKKKTKSSTTSDTKSEVSEGWYHPRSVIIREEGGHEFEENIIAADK